MYGLFCGLQIALCEMCRRRNGIVRNRKQDYISLVIDPDASHESVIEKAANLLQLRPEKCSLMHLNGCRIVDSEIIDNDGSHRWSIGRYLQKTYAKNSSYKIGILCEDTKVRIHGECNSITNYNMQFIQSDEEIENDMPPHRSMCTLHLVNL